MFIIVLPVTVALSLALIAEVRVAMIGKQFAAPSGNTLKMDGNHHL